MTVGTRDSPTHHNHSVASAAGKTHGLTREGGGRLGCRPGFPKGSWWPPGECRIFPHHFAKPSGVTHSTGGCQQSRGGTGLAQRPPLNSPRGLVCCAPAVDGPIQGGPTSRLDKWGRADNRLVPCQWAADVSPDSTKLCGHRLKGARQSGKGVQKKDNYITRTANALNHARCLEHREFNALHREFSGF